MEPSLTALLDDPSIDHTGPPIPVGYDKIWDINARANRKQRRTLSQDDVDFIQQKLAPIVAQSEWEQGNTYYHAQWPICDGNAGLKDAKFVPIRLNLEEGETVNSFACFKALINVDLVSKRSNTLPVWLIPRDLVRWRIDGLNDHLKNKLPARWLVWQSLHEALSGAVEGLYARIPKPLVGLSRGASCDHCRIHDQKLVGESVDYFDDRPGVNGIREKRVVDTAATPFSLCRYHWWYVQSGQLLRRSHVHALEMLLSEELSERWGFFHMSEFLYCVEEQSEALYERDRLALDKAWGLIPTVLVDDDPRMRNSHPPLTRAETADKQDAEGLSPPIVTQETDASADVQPLVLGDQAAVTTAADADQQSNDAPASHATDLVAPNSPVPVAQPQTNGTSARRGGGLLYPPPTMPLFMRSKCQRTGNRASSSQRGRRYVSARGSASWREAGRPH